MVQSRRVKADTRRRRSVATVLAGRDDEMAVLLAHPAAAEAGEEQFVVLQAAPGVGATAIVDHLAAAMSRASFAKR